MQTVILTGHIAAVLVFFLFLLLWIRETRKISKGKPGVGTMFNAAGFGLLPGLAVWKIFEPYYGLDVLSGGKKLFDPFGPAPCLTWDGRFLPERIELAALMIAFIAIVIWLIARRDFLPGNGDLFLTVICLWSAIRAVTETLRNNPLRIGEISVFIVTSAAAEIAVMAVWTVRREKKHSGPVLTALECLAVLGCCTVSILQDAEILTTGSEIGNLAIAAGCSVLAAAIILSAGKDSREE